MSPNLAASPTAADAPLSPPRRAIAWWHWWPLLLVLAVGVGTTLRYQPPAALPETAPADVFSAARAFHHVEAIAQAPHPRGTPQNEVVRDYIIDELTRLGLEPKIQRAIAPANPKETRLPLPVENIFAKLPGTTAGPAVMLAAHYDSAPKAPGASDDGAAVASLIETVRALRSGGPLRNDVLLVFTDGEEGGLLGARALVAEPSAMSNIGLVLNFDARGTRGPSIMFETSAGNARLIEAFASAAPDIVATSLTASIYRWLPNRTDFTVFRKAGLAGLNFAFIGGHEHYHQPSDIPAHLDRRTLQQTGNYALALTRHFGSVPLPLASSGDAAYFTVVPPWFAHYPMTLVIPLAIGLIAMAGWVGMLALRSGEVTWRGTATACFNMGMGTLAAAAIAIGFYYTYMAAGIHPGSSLVPLGLTLALAVGLVVITGGRLAKKTTPADRLFGALLLWTALAVVFAGVVPGGAHLFFWPASIGWAAFQFSRARLRQSGASGMAYPGIWPGVAAAILLGPTLYLLWVALPAALAVVAACTALICYWVLPAGEAAAPKP